MTARPEVFLGSFVVGEVPATLVYQYLDADGASINLTGYGVIQFQWGLDDHGLITDATVTSGSVADAVTGQVSYAWTGAEFATTGPHAGLFFVNNGNLQLASVLITWQVCASGATPPTP